MYLTISFHMRCIEVDFIDALDEVECVLLIPRKRNLHSSQTVMLFLLLLKIITTSVQRVLENTPMAVFTLCTQIHFV